MPPVRPAAGLHIPGRKQQLIYFTAYAEELHKLQVAKAKLAEAQEAMATLEEAITYVAVAYGDESPITEHLIQQAEDTRQSVDKMVSNSTVKQALCMT